MKENQTTLLQDMSEVGISIISFLKLSKIYLVMVATIAWVFSTYNVKDILILFALTTVIDTITRIAATSRKNQIPFNPLKKIFWLQIKSSGLKMMGRKVFVEYGIAVLIAFFVDIFVFKSTLNFNLLSLRLNIPMCSILFFTGIEIWSIFENIEDAGYRNWLKIFLSFVKDFIPDNWKNTVNKLKKLK